MNSLLQVSLRQQAVFVPAASGMGRMKYLSGTGAVLAANLASLGYGLSENLFRALNEASPAFQEQVLKGVMDIKGVHKNWTPLVKGWQVPTGESIVDHIITIFANVFKGEGTALPCGHIIPADTFPLERYNGCPFCGTPFTFGELEYANKSGRLKMLELWTEKELEGLLNDLLQSKTALDATQMDSLLILLEALPLPAVNIAIKETRMVVISRLLDLGRGAEAQALFATPTDVLRYLWYKHTGFLQLIEPAVIVRRMAGNAGVEGRWKAERELKLKYSRKESIAIAGWLNSMPVSVEAMCETMHPKRRIWVRFIRALRLAEYSKRTGFEKLALLMDKFYNKDYKVWEAQVSEKRIRYDVAAAMTLLKQRPGLFARSLFANMLWFGYPDVTAAFEEVLDKVPMRMLLTLDMYADSYFTKGQYRTVKPLGGIAKSVPPPQLTFFYSTYELEHMKEAVADLCKTAVRERFKNRRNTSRSIYIDPELFRMPLAIGDRAATLQDQLVVPMGTRFAVEGTSVRLFMQWGMGLDAQHLDMDLSCLVMYRNKVERCSYSSLVITGCKHSGDIQSVPDEIGTAEYIEIDVKQLQKAEAEYVVFTCNAFTSGALSPEMVVGWMNSEYPMSISNATGVAYNPADVQHQVRVTGKLDKGMVFGVLNVQANEIMWLEMPFDGQVAQNLDLHTVRTLITKLASKMSIGQMLEIKAEAQLLAITEKDLAEEVYTGAWGLNAAAVTGLFID